MAGELARRPGPTVRTRVREVRTGADPSARVREDRLATEEPLEIRLAAPGIAPRRVWVTMRTPGHDFELAAGYLVAEGIAEPSTIEQVAYCTDRKLDPEQEFNVVTVTLRTPPLIVPASRTESASAGSAACGVCGKDSIQEVLASSPSAGSTGGFVPEPDVVAGLPGELHAAQQTFRRTGGLHGCGLADRDGKLRVVREDIGRHNAMDKALGSAYLAGTPTAGMIGVLSGRIGFELVQKAAAARLGCLVAVGAPSSMAVRLADEAGIGLVGFTREDRHVVYVDPASPRF